MWKLGRASHNSSPAYQKINSEVKGDGGCETRRGFVPVLVGKDINVMERLCVPLKLVKHPCIAALLDMSADEFGYGQDGLIKIKFDPECFKQMVKRISKEKR